MTTDSGECTVHLCVCSSDTRWGESVAVVGNLEQLSNWAQSNKVLPIRLSPDPYPLWRVTLTLPSDTRVEYKYVILRSQGQLVWENLSSTTASSNLPPPYRSSNRSFNTPPPLHVLAVNDGTLHTHRAQLPIVASPSQSLPDLRKLAPDPVRRRVVSARDVYVHQQSSFSSTAACGLPITSRELKSDCSHDEPRATIPSPTLDGVNQYLGVDSKGESSVAASRDRSALDPETGLMSILADTKCDTTGQKWFQAVPRMSHEACSGNQQSDMLFTLESARATVEQLRVSIAAMRPAMRTVASLARHSCASSIASTTISELASVERVATESSMKHDTPKNIDTNASVVASAPSEPAGVSLNQNEDSVAYDCSVNPSPADALNITQRSVDDALAQVASLRAALSNILSRLATADASSMLETNPSHIVTSTASQSSGESCTQMDDSQFVEEADETFDEDIIEPVVSPHDIVIESNDTNQFLQDIQNSDDWAPGSFLNVSISTIVCGAIAIWLWGPPVIIFFATVLLAVAMFAALAATSDHHFSLALILDRLKNFPNSHHVHND